MIQPEKIIDLEGNKIVAISLIHTKLEIKVIFNIDVEPENDVRFYNKEEFMNLNILAQLLYII